MEQDVNKRSRHLKYFTYYNRNFKKAITSGTLSIKRDCDCIHFKMDDVHLCLDCPKCSYILKFDNGYYHVHGNYSEDINNNLNYTIEIIDEIEYKNILELLKNEEIDFRVMSEDGVITRLDNETYLEECLNNPWVDISKCFEDEKLNRKLK